MKTILDFPDHRILIAEAGNCHFGNFKLAQEMIKAAKASGADLVKFQAFDPDKVVNGSMPAEFYRKVAFTLNQYEDLIDFGRMIGIEVFYSIFDDKFAPLLNKQKYRKFSGSQTIANITGGNYFDLPNSFASFPQGYLFAAGNLKNCIPLYVTKYLPSDPDLMLLEYLKKVLDFRFQYDMTSVGVFGYSDHFLGIDSAVMAVKHYGASVIEKHFTLQKNVSYGKDVFRDTIHGSTPDEFEKLAKVIHG